jgi:hypothetical protein
LPLLRCFCSPAVVDLKISPELLNALCHAARGDHRLLGMLDRDGRSDMRDLPDEVDVPLDEAAIASITRLVQAGVADPSIRYFGTLTPAELKRTWEDALKRTAH